MAESYVVGLRKLIRLMRWGFRLQQLIELIPSG